MSQETIFDAQYSIWQRYEQFKSRQAEVNVDELAMLSHIKGIESLKTLEPRDF